MVLILLTLVLPWQYVVVRLVIGAAIVFVAAPLVVRMVAEPETLTIGPALRATPASEIPADASANRYFQSVTRLGAYLLPEYLVLGVALGGLSGWLLPLSHSAVSWGFGAVVVAAVAGTILVIPTGAELTIIIGLAALGFPIAVSVRLQRPAQGPVGYRMRVSTATWPGWLVEAAPGRPAAFARSARAAR